MDWKWIKLCSGEYVNTITCKGKKLEACNRLSEFLVNHEAADLTKPIDLRDVDQLIVTGFLL